MIPHGAFAFFGLLLTALLLAFSKEALAAAADGLSLWWTAVLPTLFPFYIGTSLLLSGGAFAALSRLAARPAKALNLPRAFIPAFVFGAVAGYPTGARLANESGCEGLAPFSNLCSPIFMLGVVGAGLLGDALLALPILAAHYGAALLAALLQSVLGGFGTACAQKTGPAAAPFSLIGAIGEGMSVMLRIGGSIVLFLVLSALLEKAGLFALVSRPFTALGAPEDAVYAILTGLMEFTCGCRAVALAKLSPRLTTSLIAALTSFGGLCVFLQAAMFLDIKRPAKYLLAKSFQAVLAFCIAYLLFPLFPAGEVPAMRVDPAMAKENATAAGTLLFVSALAMAFVYLLANFLCRIRRPAGRSQP